MVRRRGVAVVLLDCLPHVGTQRVERSRITVACVGLQLKLAQRLHRMPSHRFVYRLVYSMPPGHVMVIPSSLLSCALK